MKRTFVMIVAMLVSLSSIPAQSPPPDSEWIDYEETDPITDESKVFLILEADGPKNYFKTKERLVIRATSETIELFIIWNTFLGSDIEYFKLRGKYIGGKYIDFRVGNNPAQRTFWSNSTDGKASFYIGDISELLQQIAKADRFVVRCTPSYQDPITLFFNTTGLEYYLSKYKSYFPWYSSIEAIQ